MDKKVYFFFYISVSLILITCNSQNVSFELSVIHYNDFHDRIEETNEHTGTCKIPTKCIGGVARLYTAIQMLKNLRPNPIVLNAGDNFQGSIWYTYYKWNATQHFVNLLSTDVHTLGNHEFDDGLAGVIPYLKALNAPVVVANIDNSSQPEFQELIRKSVVIERAGKKIGIIGVITSKTPELSKTTNLIFKNESDSVNNEAEKLVREHNVDTIIVLSHCGYSKDKIIAARAASKISLIVGGHSHVLLYPNETTPSNDRVAGPYPTIINHKDGRQILIVQALGFSKYLGDIVVRYDNAGNVVSWQGFPIYLNTEIQPNERIREEVEIWKRNIKNINMSIIGETKVYLSKQDCFYGECNLGNFITDAMVYSHINTAEDNAWTYAAMAFTNFGSFRTSIPKGSINRNDLSMLTPFRNTYDVIELQGIYLRRIFEKCVDVANSNARTKLLQVSGLNIVYNMSKTVGSKLQSIKVRCRECDIPVYENLVDERMYRIVCNSHIVNGKGGFNDIIKHAKLIKTGPNDIDALSYYITKHSPIIQGLEDRIKMFY